MSSFIKSLKPAFLCFVAMTLICGVIYTGAVTGVAKLLFSNKANGSIVTVTLKDGTKVDYGSELIAQEFTSKEYLIGRPMGNTNLSPTSKEQQKLVEERVEWWRDFDSKNEEDIPIDLVTSSASGVDPYISKEAAAFQVKRIAEARGMDESRVEEIISKYTKDRILGFMGQPGVNVLKVNLALDNLL